MATNLVVVESPTKARTIEKFLGAQYQVRACLGHVRDLPKSKLGVDVSAGFAPQYLVPREKQEIVRKLKDQARDAQAVYLATDPDREGEAIAWHLAEALELDSKPVHRVEFHEVTRGAVLAAMAAPRTVDANRVDAQQARRVLDRLVGYLISPLLWKKVRRGLSAGRVQSVAVRLVVDREKEIQAFVPQEYWTIDAELSKVAQPETAFRAALVEHLGAKPELKDQNQVAKVLASLEACYYKVKSVRRRDQRRNPSPPFTTSTLQQEASRRLGFTAKRTMAVAQQLYEGIKVEAGEETGLITYMRTDSTQVAQSAQEEARQFLSQRYGSEALPPSPRVYRTKSRLAQEAHEAIRPTSVFREPSAVARFLTPDQRRLYELIWRRFVASQMASAVFDVTTVEIATLTQEGQERALFRASGSTMKQPGFLSVYSDEQEEEANGQERRNGGARQSAALPPVAEGESLDLLQLLPEQHFTQPPPRYTEATLVKALEERGIGRPSTYAPILSTIQDRGYVVREDRRLKPTDLGFLVNDLLVGNFPDVVDVDFTANLEEHLDDIARGEKPWVPVVQGFYEPLTKALAQAETIQRVKLPVEETDEVCEQCGRPMVIRTGRFGRFVACSGFPDCRNARPLQKKTGAQCPLCGGDIVERRARRTRRIFYGCNHFPTCNWTSWSRPLPEPCPVCGGLMVEAGQGGGRCLTCSASPPEGEAHGSPEPDRRRVAGGRRSRSKDAG